MSGGGAYWNRPTQDTDLRGQYAGRPGPEAPGRQFNERPTAYHHLMGRERAGEVDRLRTEGFVHDNDMRPGVDPLASRPKQDDDGILRITVDNDRFRRGLDVPAARGYADVVSQQLSVLRHSTDTQGSMQPPSVIGATSYRPPEASGANSNRAESLPAGQNFGAKLQSDTDWRMPPSNQMKESSVSSSMEKASDILARLESWKKISMRSQEVLRKPIFGSAANPPQPRLDVTASAQEKLMKNINRIVETFGSGSAGNKPTSVSLPDSFIAPLSAAIAASSTAGSFPTNQSPFGRLSSAAEAQQPQTFPGMNSTPAAAAAAAAAAATTRQQSPPRAKPDDKVFSLKYRQPPTSTPQTSAAAPTNDPIFADVLKSIGFNFDFSRFAKQEPEQPKPPVSATPMAPVPVSVPSVSHVPNPLPVQMPPGPQMAPPQFGTMQNVVSNPPFVPVGIPPPFPVPGMPPQQAYGYPNLVPMSYPPPPVRPPFNVGPAPHTDNRPYDIRITKEFGSEKKRKVEVCRTSRDSSSRSRSLSPSERRDSNKTRKSPKSIKRRSRGRQKSKGNGRQMEEHDRRSRSKGDSLPRRSQTKDRSGKRADSSPRRHRERSSSMGSRRRERSPKSPISIRSSTSSASFSPHTKRRSIRGARLSRERTASPPMLQVQAPRIQPPIGFPEPGYYPPPYGPPPPFAPIGPMQPLLPPWLTPRDPRQHPSFRTQNAEEEDWKRSTEEFLQRMNRPSRSTLAQSPPKPISLPVRPVSPSILSNCSSVSSGSMESLLDDGTVTKGDGSGKVSKLASFLAEQLKKIEDLERELSELKRTKNTSGGDADSSATESKRTETQVESEITVLRGSMEEEKKKVEEKKKEKKEKRSDRHRAKDSGATAKGASSKGMNRAKDARKTSKVEASSEAGEKKKKDEKTKEDNLQDKQLKKGPETRDKSVHDAAPMSVGGQGKESVQAEKDAASASELSAANGTQSSSTKKESTAKKVDEAVDKNAEDKVKSAPAASKDGKDSAKDKTLSTERQKESSRGSTQEKDAAAVKDKKVAPSDSDRHLHQADKKKSESRRDSRSHKSADRSSCKAAETSTETSRRHSKDDERKDHDRSDRDRSSKSVNRSRSRSRGKDRDVVGYKDNGGHWCGVCNCEFDTISDFLSHLETSRTHKQLAIKQQSAKPKLDMTVKSVDKSKHGRMENVKGSEFMVAVLEPFYCKLCSLFINDVSQAAAHLRSAEHNTEYKNYIKRHGDYEREFVQMKSKIRDRKPSAATKRRSGNNEENTDEQKKLKRSSSPDKKKPEDKRDGCKSSSVVEKESGKKATDSSVDTNKSSASESVTRNDASEVLQKSDSKEEAAGDATEKVESKGEAEAVSSDGKQEVAEQEPVISADSNAAPLKVSITNYMSDISSRDSMSPVSDDGIDLGPINLVFVSGGGSGLAGDTRTENPSTVSESAKSPTEVINTEVVNPEVAADVNSSSEVAAISPVDDVIIVETPAPDMVDLMDDDTAEYSLPAIEVNSSSDGSCVEVDVKVFDGKATENTERKFAAVTVTKQEVCDVEMSDEVTEGGTTTSAKLLGEEINSVGCETEWQDVREALSSADNDQGVNKVPERMVLELVATETGAAEDGSTLKDGENQDRAVDRETAADGLEKEFVAVSEVGKETASSEHRSVDEEHRSVDEEHRSVEEEDRSVDRASGDGIELPIVGNNSEAVGQIDLDGLDQAPVASITERTDEENVGKGVESDISDTVSDQPVVCVSGVTEKSYASCIVVSAVEALVTSSVEVYPSDSKVDAEMIASKSSSVELGSSLDPVDAEKNEISRSDEQKTGQDQLCVIGAVESSVTEEAEKLQSCENNQDSASSEAAVSESVLAAQAEPIESLIRADDGGEMDKNEDSECRHVLPCHSSGTSVPLTAPLSSSAVASVADSDLNEAVEHEESTDRPATGVEENMTTTAAAVDLAEEDAETEKLEEEEDFEIDLL